jgi:hypothetical protein
MHRPFALLKRGAIWYVRFRDPATGKRLVARSTGETREETAHVWALEHMPKTPEAERDTKTFGEFARDFFEWEICDWIARQHANGKNFTYPTAQIRRSHVVNYLLPAFESRPLADITAKERRSLSGWPASSSPGRLGTISSAP